MTKKIIFISLILIVIFFVFLSRNKTESMVNPLLKPVVTAQSSPAMEIKQPQEIQYDGSTDLKKELDSVDPQVLDSDFK